MKRASRVNVIEAARRATVRVCDENGDHRGQGLLLDLEGEGTVVLTCHHVVATLERGHLFVAIPQPNGELGKLVQADYDGDHSRPEMDAVVLRVKLARDELFEERPWLCALNHRTYNGELAATGFVHMQPGRFFATLRTGTRLHVPVARRGAWPSPPDYYLPSVFVLDKTSDAREGISGGVVLCGDGVLGLTHLTRY